MSERKITYAIRYTGPGAGGPGNWTYVTTAEPTEAKRKTRYAYCCPCKETLQFASFDAAETYAKENGLSLEFFIPPGKTKEEGSYTHTIVDSVTAKKQKDAVKSPPPEAPKPSKPVSALTGATVKWK